MKKAIIAIACIIYAGSLQAQDLAANYPHTDYNRIVILKCQQKETNTLVHEKAALAVLQDRYRRDQEYHPGRLPRTRERELYNDNVAIQNQQAAIKHTAALLEQYREWLAL